MAISDVIRVHGNGGLEGTTSGRPHPGAHNRMRVQLDSGQVVLLPTELLHLEEDGSFYVDLSTADLEPYMATEQVVRDQRGESQSIPITEERLRVGKRQVEGDIVRITKQLNGHEETIDTPLLSENYDVQRVAINEVVDGPAPIREEGDTIIVPIYEEVLVVEKRLMLREELHLVRHTEERQDARRVTLRREEAHVDRQPPQQREAG